MATAKSTPQPAETAPETPAEPTLEEFALSRGQRVNGGVDSGVELAYREYLARRAAS